MWQVLDINAKVKIKGKTPKSRVEMPCTHIVIMIYRAFII